MKPVYLFVIMLAGIGLVFLDAAFQTDTSDDSFTGSGNYSPHTSEQKESSRPLRTIGWIVIAAAGIPFAVWKATYFFNTTGRHGY